jgi:hypothetical protein
MYFVDGTRGEDTDGGRSLSIGIHYLDTLFHVVNDRLLIMRFTVVLETGTKEHIKNPPPPSY